MANFGKLARLGHEAANIPQLLAVIIYKARFVADILFHKHNSLCGQVLQYTLRITASDHRESAQH